MFQEQMFKNMLEEATELMTVTLGYTRCKHLQVVLALQLKSTPMCALFNFQIESSLFGGQKHFLEKKDPYKCANVLRVNYNFSKLLLHPIFFPYPGLVSSLSRSSQSFLEDLKAVV